MIGQDLAFDKEGNSHSKGFDFGEKFSGEENIDKLKVPAYAEKVYQNIENFNHSLDEDEFIQDEVLRGAFAYRGKMIADVLKLHIQDKTHFITAYVKAYDEWLLYFMEKLGQKYKFLSKV